LKIKYKIQETRIKVLFSFVALFFAFCFLFLGASFTGCSVHYGFRDRTGIPDSIKTVKVSYIDNRARYINPQLSPRLTDKLRQKIISQTKLTQTNGDNADWEISGYITDYSFSTSAISGQQAANNRLTVGLHITLNNRKTEDSKDYDVNRNFEFKGNQTLQQAEASLLDEMVRTLTDEIFNKLFSNW
jgi:basic membrane lipoprotein Med (substrate-binding protein (PBP1-ABC) superfamily)